MANKIVKDKMNTQSALAKNRITDAERMAALLAQDPKVNAAVKLALADIEAGNTLSLADITGESELQSTAG